MKSESLPHYSAYIKSIVFSWENLSICHLTFIGLKGWVYFIYFVEVSLIPLLDLEDKLVAPRMRVIFTKRKPDSPVLMDLHWLPVNQRVSLKILLRTYKALNSIAPKYILDLLVQYRPVLRLYTRGSLLLQYAPSADLFLELAPSHLTSLIQWSKTREQKFCCVTIFFAWNRWYRRGSFALGACCGSVLQA